MSTLYVNTLYPTSGDTVNVSGSLTVSGHLNLGDANTDSVSFGAEVSSSILPDADNTYDLGSISKSWRTIFTNTASIDFVSSSLIPDADITYDLGSAAKRWNNVYAANFNASGSTAFSGSVTVSGSSTFTNWGNFRNRLLDNRNFQVTTDPTIKGGYRYGQVTPNTGSAPHLHFMLSGSGQSGIGLLSPQHTLHISSSRPDLRSGWSALNVDGNVSINTGSNAHSIALNVTGSTIIGSNLTVLDNTTFGTQPGCDDTHTFHGHVTLSCNLSSSGNNSTFNNISASNIGGTLTTAAQANITSVGTLTSLNSSGVISGSSVSVSNNVTVLGNTTLGNSCDDTTTLNSNVNILCTLSQSGQNAYFNNITASNNITTLTGQIQAEHLVSTDDLVVTNNITASGNISSSGNNSWFNNISASNIGGTLSTANQSNITNVGTLTTLAVSGDVTMSALLSSSGCIHVACVTSSGGITGTNISASGWAYVGGNLHARGTDHQFGDPYWESYGNGGTVLIYGNLTGSNDISASGDIWAANISASNNLTVTNNITANGSATLGNHATNDSHTITGVTQHTGDLTVEGNISGSKALYIGVDDQESDGTPGYFVSASNGSLELRQWAGDASLGHHNSALHISSSVGRHTALSISGSEDYVRIALGSTAGAPGSTKPMYIGYQAEQTSKKGNYLYIGGARNLGTNALVVSSSGVVGIGVKHPSASLDISNAGATSASIHVTGSYTDIRFGTTLPVFNHIGVKDDIGSFISGKTVDSVGQLATGSLYVRVSGSGTGRVAQVCIYGY